MIDHGFPVAGFRFDWDESIDYTPEQQRQVEDMLLRYYDVDPKYWIEKYNIPVIEKKQDRTAQLVKPISSNDFLNKNLPLGHSSELDDAHSTGFFD